jgi:membrane associated rhomboid family serine protease
MIPIKDYPGTRRSFPWVMLSLVLANILVFIFELGIGDSRALDRLFASAGVVPVEFTQGTIVAPPPPLGITWITLFTSMFLHGGLLHIGSNMLYLFIFGDNVEDRLGRLRFVLFYFLCGLAAGATHILANPSSTVPSIGASGAIAGVLAGYLVLFPHAEVRTLLLIGPFILMPRIAAAFLIVFWFITQLFDSVMSLGATSEQTSGGVAVWAHVGGFIAGLILVRLMRPRQPVGVLGGSAP